jgi:outer membrane protein assembly factor BamB
MAAVAGIFSLIVCALMLYDFSRRQAKDPFEAVSYKALKAALAQQPTNDELKSQIRVVDAGLRGEYFRQRAFAAVGTGLLLGGLAIFLLAARSAATLRRQLPHPEPQAVPQDAEIETTHVARWAVGALALLLVCATVGLSFALRTEMPRPEQELAAAPGAAATPAPTGSTETQPAPSGSAAAQVAASTAEAAVTAEAPPSDEEAAKMWPRFRGPGGLGIAAYTNVPTAWNAKSGENILWKADVPLPGNSSPVVWGKHIFLTGASETERKVFCFDAEKGTLLWQQEAPGTPQSTASPPKINDDTGFAASTAATDGRRVYAIFANGDLAAFDFQGKLAWSRSLGVPDNSYGHAASLATYKNLLLVQVDQATAKDKKSKLLALDAASGKTVWQADRPVASSWTTPIVIHAADRDQLITSADPWVTAYNPADGSEIWRAHCMRQDVAPSPIFADGIVYVANQFPCLAAIRADGSGEVTKTHVLWKGEDGLPDTCSPLATKEYVFLLASEGTLTCYDAKKGDKLWEKDFETATFAASPSLVGNRLYLIGTEGKSWIVEPGKEEAKIVGQADVGENCVATPAFQDGRMYLRGKDHLFCIGKP